MRYLFVALITALLSTPAIAQQKVFVTDMTASGVTVYEVDADDTVADLRKMIKEKTGKSVTGRKMIIDRTGFPELEDDRLISSYNIGMIDTVRIFP